MGGCVSTQRLTFYSRLTANLFGMSEPPGWMESVTLPPNFGGNMKMDDYGLLAEGRDPAAHDGIDWHQHSA